MALLHKSTSGPMLQGNLLPPDWNAQAPTEEIPNPQLAKLQPILEATRLNVAMDRQGHGLVSAWQW